MSLRNSLPVACLLLTTLLLTGCRERWRSRYYERGRQGAYRNGACVSDEEFYAVDPERMLRKEHRELRQWYRELELDQQDQRAVRSRRTRGLQRSAAHGFSYEEGAMVGEYGLCSECGNFAGDAYGMQEPMVNLGHAQSFDGMSGDQWTTADGMPFQGDTYYNQHSTGSCPVCGQHGSAYQIPAEQMIPHAPSSEHQSAPYPAGSPPADPAAPTSPPGVTAPMPPATELEPVPTPAPSASAPVEQMYFVPPLR